MLARTLTLTTHARAVVRTCACLHAWTYSCVHAQPNTRARSTETTDAHSPHGRDADAPQASGMTLASLRRDGIIVSSNVEPRLRINSKKSAAEREEAKAVLLQFLKNLGLSTTLSSRLTKKGGNFVDHLLAILHSRYYGSCNIGIEPTTAEIQETLLSYLSALAAQHGEGLVDFLVYFPDPPPVRSFSFGTNPFLLSPGKCFQTRDHTGTSRLTLEGNFRPAVSYALSLGLSLDELEALAKKSPGFISCKPERNIQPVVSYFLGLGVTKPGIIKIMLKRPQLFVCNLEEYLKPSMLYLESLGVKKSQWPRILVNFPALLMYGTTKIQATVEFLHRVGFSSADVGGIISRYPHIVSFSVGENLEPTLEFLKNIGVNDTVVFLRKLPQVLGYSVEGNMKPTIRFLIELGYSQTQVTTIINKFPQILGLAINSNIKPKWDYYADTGWPKSHLVSFPQYFGYRLETRIKPRFREVLNRGLYWTPNRILSASDTKFERLLGIHDGQLEELHPLGTGVKARATGNPSSLDMGPPQTTL